MFQRKNGRRVDFWKLGMFLKTVMISEKMVKIKCVLNQILNILQVEPTQKSDY